MMTLEEKFQQFIDAHHLFDDHKRIVLAISGGMDSVTMLHLFSRIQFTYHLELAIAHLNHQLRGDAADADETFVKDLAAHFQIPFFSERVDVRQVAIEHSASVETIGRTLRFDFFRRIKERLGFDVIALGHHRDDHAETILMNLARGSGLRGLSGIQVVRDDVMHPILFATRSGIETFVRKNNIPFKVDETNLEQVFLRNRIRVNVIQSLKSIYGESVIDSIHRCSEAAREAQTYIHHQAMTLFESQVIRQSDGEIVLDIAQFLKYFITIQKETLVQVFQEFTHRGNTLRYTDLKRLLDLIQTGSDGQKVLLQNHCEAVRLKGQIIFYKPFAPLQPKSITSCGEFSIDELNYILGIEKIKSVDAVRFSNNPHIEYVDLDKIDFPLTLRSRMDGDRFYPIGSPGHKKLHDFFIDEKVMRHKRDRIPVLESDHQIVWVIGHRLDRRFRITDATRHIAELSWKLKT